METPLAEGLALTEKPSIKIVYICSEKYSTLLIFFLLKYCYMRPVFLVLKSSKDDSNF